LKRFNCEPFVTRSIKLSDVAKAAGVSLGTASNVFNRPAVVRAEVREQVEAAALALGYSGPDPVGRMLMGGKANAIGVLPGGDMSVSFALSSPYLRAMLLGIAEICDENGASLVVVSGSGDRKEWAIRNALVDGFVLGNVDEIEMVRARRRPVPFVMMDMEGGPEVSSVCIDGYGGARQQAEHLLALGHRRFAILAVQRRPVDAVFHAPGRKGTALKGGYPLDHQKLCAYADTLADAGISIDDVPMVEAFPPSPFAEAGAKLLLDHAPEATAVLCMADKSAIAVIGEATSRGIRVPEDLSIIGFDDVENASSTTPPLTTIAQRTDEKGRVAARMLFAGGPPRQEVMKVELMVRKSTARVRQH
jgi:DNA-binding LacI/PurR family transcriptional regulator